MAQQTVLALECRKTYVIAPEKSAPTEADKQSIPCESH